MSKVKSKDNILVDLHNLELTETPDQKDGINPDSQDDTMILEFFKKYDPKVASYVTDYIFTYSDGEQKGTFKEIKGKPYFQSDQVIYFYELWQLVKNLVDSHRNHTNTTTTQLEDVLKLLSDIKHSLLLTDSSGNRIVVRDGYFYNKNIPKEIDLSQYSVEFYLDDSGEYIFGGTGIYLTLGKLKYRLFNAIIQFLNKEIEIKKCNALDCENIYIPTPRGRNQEFCSDRCYKRTYTRARRRKIKESVFV